MTPRAPARSHRTARLRHVELPSRRARGLEEFPVSLGYPLQQPRKRAGPDRQPNFTTWVDVLRLLPSGERARTRTHTNTRAHAPVHTHISARAHTPPSPRRRKTPPPGPRAPLGPARPAGATARPVLWPQHRPAQRWAAPAFGVTSLPPSITRGPTGGGGGALRAAIRPWGHRGGGVDILLFLSHLPAAGKYPLAVPEMLTRVDSPETPTKSPKRHAPTWG